MSGEVQDQETAADPAPLAIGTLIEELTPEQKTKVDAAYAEVIREATARLRADLDLIDAGEDVRFASWALVDIHEGIHALNGVVTSGYLPLTDKSDDEAWTEFTQRTVVEVDDMALIAAFEALGEEVPEELSEVLAELKAAELKQHCSRFVASEP